ncbi:acetyltransferase, GNAT superfamily protein [Acanthamoeba castellanii str. Neff]|uniref:Acetyltransferase, GNAT superfamily protein n=1 Tax=Acanthamoeba castellanii (strain ATCC 30010 / Neff) TaxID=1257118 RepID=L8GHE7_ACACF|nr:acetyltransferase, GNAT superfamily protein [Acanthamoeba castellanii str. Neff]ELR11586.1 acetyltransferase, GNAT superfamily protein [Acanthamoeba castellanii str. Neff]
MELKLHFRQCSLSDLDRLDVLETASYPEDEAASREKLAFRLTHAAPYFRCATTAQNGEEQVVGFVCGTLAVGQTLTHSSMSQHTPEGSTLCIHSVVVDERCRGNKVGTRMLKEYMHHVASHQANVELVLLLCKANLKPFYGSCGFEEVAESGVVHGQEKWFEMKHVPRRQ